MKAKNSILIPENNNQLTLKKLKSGTYLYLTIGREYIKEKRYYKVKRTCIGLVDPNNDKCFYPNEKYSKHFKNDAIKEVTKEVFNTKRSSCIKIGTYILFTHLLKEQILSYQKNKSLITIDYLFYSLIEPNKDYDYYTYNHITLSQDTQVKRDEKDLIQLNEILKTKIQEKTKKNSLEEIINELEKIEMFRYEKGKYKLYQKLTEKQKKILFLFKLTEEVIIEESKNISIQIWERDLKLSC